MILFEQGACPGSIYIAAEENSAVQLAVQNLSRDVEKVCGVRPEIVHMLRDDTRIVVATLSHLPEGVDAAPLLAEDGQPRWEALLQRVEGNRLYLLGSDRRGAIYAVYDLCEKMGVSPWYDMADVPVKQQRSIVCDDHLCHCDWPRVKYRGIFLNDEEELEAWAYTMNGEETIGPKTYAKIFELILRLKGNYIWPAMHVNAFNINPENGELAERMGIVTGTSHCDMLHRSNQNEWNWWKERNNRPNAEYDYTIPGENRAWLLDYWRGSLEQHRAHECCYTIGMRGIHDSGFETRNLTDGKRLTEEEIMGRKRALLEEIFTVQRELIEQAHPNEEIPQAFVPYKEVLPIYDSGLRVPEDVTLVWVDDNHGYVRRYPSKQEQKRKGGNGLYYHSSYWAPPGMSWLLVCSTPLAHLGNELKKCYEQHIRQMWVDNVGALKPIEVDMSYFLRCGWDGDREGSMMMNPEAFLTEFVNRSFSGDWGAEMATLHGRFRQLSNLCKPEHMRSGVFSQTAYGDEAAARLKQMQEIEQRVESIYHTLPEAEQPAFHQLFLMQMKVSTLIAASYYYADRSYLAYALGAMRAADENMALSRKMDDGKRMLLHHYNEVMLDGKWRNILTPEDFPPPPLELYPACKPALDDGDDTVKLLLPTDGIGTDGLHFFTDKETRWIDLFGTRVDAPYTAEADEGISVTPSQGVLGAQERLLVRVSPEFVSGQIRIHVQGRTLLVPVQKRTDGQPIHLPAQEGDMRHGFTIIRGMGRGLGDAVEASAQTSLEHPAEIRFCFVLPAPCAPEGEIVRFLTLHSNGEIRLRVRVDGGEEILLASQTRDEYTGNWIDAAMHNGEKLHFTLPELTAGEHELTVEALDAYVTLCAVNLYPVARQECLLGPGVLDGGVALPDISAEKECQMFHVRQEDVALPWDIFCGDTFWRQHMVHARITTRERPEKRGAERVWTDGAGRKNVLAHLHCGVVQEVNGHLAWEAENALLQTENANHTPGWTHRQAETNGRTGLAMWVEKPMAQGADAPRMQYRIHCQQDAVYHLWLLAKVQDVEQYHLHYLMDGQPASQTASVCREDYYSYRNINTWCWQKVLSMPLTAGEHTLTLEAHCIRLSIDRLYMTTGDENPPTDALWEET